MLSEQQQTAFRARNLRPLTRNTLRGFFDLLLPSGLTIRDCTLHEKGDRRWIGLPGKAQLTSDGQARRDPATGKIQYLPVIEIGSRAVRDRFQEQAVAAVEQLLSQGER